MLYQDSVFGEVEILEPVVLEIINCAAMQRLKGVSNAGYFKPFFGPVGTTRFEHSLGVFLLLKKYNAKLEEQLAGLIHDVSHSAFSHCIDHILKTSDVAKQDHQDNIFNDFVLKSEIPNILRKYNLDVDYILNDENFSLKERELPDLCADRIDYSLRDAINWKILTTEEVNFFLDNLVTENGFWIFKNFEIAKKFAEFFLYLNNGYYSNLATARMFAVTGDYFRYALDKKYIKIADLYTTDDEVLNKVNAYLPTDTNLVLLNKHLNNEIKLCSSPNDFDKQIVCKSRVVDPLCFDEGKIKRVSEIYPEWESIVVEESKPKEHFLKFEV